MSVAKAHIEATNPTTTINRLRPIGARLSSFSRRGSAWGLSIASPLPTKSAAPKASIKNGIKSGPRNIYYQTLRWVLIATHVRKSRVITQPSEPHGPCGAIAMLGNNHLSRTYVGGFWVVHLIAV